MKRILPKNFPWHFPKKGKEKLAKRDILVCSECGAVYWQKRWHHSLDDYPFLSEDKDIHFVVCPACSMIQEKKYEGEVIVEGLSEDLRQEIQGLIRNFGEETWHKDPMARIISVEEIAKGMLRILTTQNQLAKRLAKKIGSTFHKKPNFIYSKKEAILRAKINLGL